MGDMSDNSITQSLDPLFRDYKRVIYDNNPLVEVILQVRYPTLLRLQTEVPSAFQEKVLEQYPLYQFEELLELVPPPAPGTSPVFRELKVHRFLSSDKNWRASLSAESVSVSTKTT